MSATRYRVIIRAIATGDVVAASDPVTEHRAWRVEELALERSDPREQWVEVVPVAVYAELPRARVVDEIPLPTPQRKRTAA